MAIDMRHIPEANVLYIKDLLALQDRINSLIRQEIQERALRSKLIENDAFIEHVNYATEEALRKDYEKLINTTRK